MTITKWLTCGSGFARAAAWVALAALTAQVCPAEDNVSTFNAYVDSYLCSRLMLGPITDKRIECSKSTHKDGAESVLVKLENNMVFSVNKNKMIDPLIGQTVSATGEAKEKNGTMKLQQVTPVPAADIKPGTPGFELLDVRHFKLTGDKAAIQEKVRHELAMMPYVTEYDFISFTMTDTVVILTGWTLRETNRSTAYNLTKNVKGVEQVINNIEVLPLGRMDMQVRAAVRAQLQKFLSRYFWGSGAAIRIIVKNGEVILLGTVHSKPDSDVAYMQANSVTGVFKVFNLLRVETEQAKAAK
jgi:osmotically-inducible protein OsmY